MVDEQQLNNMVTEPQSGGLLDLWSIIKLVLFCLGIIIVIFSVFKTIPFGNESHAIDFETKSNALCLEMCEDFSKEYKCFEFTPSYMEQYVNGLQTQSKCSCYIRSCKK